MPAGWKRSGAGGDDFKRTERANRILNGPANRRRFLCQHIAQEFQRVVQIVGFAPRDFDRDATEPFDQPQRRRANLGRNFDGNENS